MLHKEFLEEHEDGVVFYRVYSDSAHGAVLQVETNVVYGEVAITDDDPYTYEEYIDDSIENSEQATVEDFENALKEVGLYD